MNIKILYDNEAEQGFCSGWGFSALINNEILFDVGEESHSLQANMRRFGVVPGQIRHAVFSHPDWDHVGGAGVLARLPDLSLYIPADSSILLGKELAMLDGRSRVVEVKERTEIDSDSFLTARFGTRKKEISLCVRTPAGLVLITGCAHPGLGRIMSHVSRFGKIHAVIGGFHGFRRLSALADVSVIVPCHCTRKKQRIFEMYPDRAQRCFAGLELDIGEGESV